MRTLSENKEYKMEYFPEPIPAFTLTKPELKDAFYLIGQVEILARGFVIFHYQPINKFKTMSENIEALGRNLLKKYKAEIKGKRK